jgi:hypothetical protein
VGDEVGGAEKKMDGVIPFESGEQDGRAAVARNTGVRVPRGHVRERILLWCIGSVFGLGMLVMLIGMCLAEISIHRGTVETVTHSAGSSSITLSATR